MMTQEFNRRSTDHGDLSESKKIMLLQTKEMEQDEKINKHHKILVEGNGDLPLPERVRNLESFIGSMKFWLRTIAVAIVLQTLTIGISVLVYFLKLYPVLQSISKP